MKVEKNKIVFAAVLVVIFIFLISYSMMVMGDDKSENEVKRSLAFFSFKINYSNYYKEYHLSDSHGKE